MDNELEVIRSEMEDTRSSLADKLETLQTQINEKVQDTTAAVTSTVQTVKDTVGNVKEAVADTVETVKDALNISKHVERHPWPMMGGAVVAGCLVGWLLGPRRTRSMTARMTQAAVPPTRQGHGTKNGSGSPRPASEEASSGPLHDTVEQLKGMAIGTLMGVIRDLVTRSVPSNLASNLNQFVDDLTTRLGGKPLTSKEEEVKREVTSTKAEDEQDAPSSRRQAEPGQRARSGGRGRR